MIQGIQIEATFVPPMPFTDEWLESVYSSVQRNMAIVSADMFVNEEASTLTFHLGIDSTLGASESFVEEVARDALDKAFEDADTDNGTTSDQSPVMVTSDVEVFA